MTTQITPTSSQRVWTSLEITEEYLSFFRACRHTQVPGSPLPRLASPTSSVAYARPTWTRSAATGAS